MCSYIALSGNLSMMKWIRSDTATRKDNVAAEERSVKRIRLTRSVIANKIRLIPLPWNEFTCRNAAKFGHLELLKWLHEQGCPWDCLTFSNAAGFGNIEMLEWLYQMKCPWDSTACSQAIDAGNWDALKWLLEWKCPFAF